MSEKYSSSALRNNNTWESEGFGPQRDQILQVTGLENTNSIKRIIYNLENSIHGSKLCSYCHVGECNWLNGKYSDTCSTKCSGLKSKQKAIDTNMKKYGVDNPSKSETVKQSIKKTTTERYGHENVMHSEQVRGKHSQSISSIDHTRANEKRSKTISERYGVSHHMQIESVREKHRETLRNNHGVTSPLQSQSLKDKRHNTMMDRYPSTLKSLSGLQVQDPHSQWVQSEASQFIMDSGFEVKLNDRTIIAPLEIDIVIPSLKIAIECNGMYWHSTAKIGDRNYHLNKKMAARDAGYELIHIYDYDWYNKNEILKSILSSKMGISNRIYARNCQIVIPSPSEQREFLDHNHMQGYTRSSFKYALVHDGEIVSMMTFSTPRFNAKYGDYELLRYCNKIGTTVIGGPSRLYKAFKKEVGNADVYSYANDDLYNGLMYEKLGMKYKGHTGPSLRYWNTKSNTAHNRSFYAKCKLKDVLPTYDESLTASQNLRNNAIYEVWGCGNSVWVQTNK